MSSTAHTPATSTGHRSGRQAWALPAPRDMGWSERHRCPEGHVSGRKARLSWGTQVGQEGAGAELPASARDAVWNPASAHALGKARKDTTEPQLSCLAIKKKIIGFYKNLPVAERAFQRQQGRARGPPWRPAARPGQLASSSWTSEILSMDLRISATRFSVSAPDTSCLNRKVC